jgi:sugar phosphate isomerase/epimerase
MNIACSTTAFSMIPLEDALSRIAALGFSYVDLLMMENWAHINPSELAEDPQGRARSTVALLRRFGLKAVALNANVSGSLTATSAGRVEQNLLEIRALVDYGKIVGASVVVVQPGSVSGESEAEGAFQASASILRSATEYADSKGLTLAIEAHSGSLAERYKDAIRFVTEVPGLKIAYDPSHCVMADLGLEGSLDLLPHSAHIHLRDAVKGNFQAPMGEGELDFMWVFEAIDTSGYSGAISIEYLDNREADILQDVSSLKKLLEARYAHL